MKLEKLNPWNWLKHEQNANGDMVPSSGVGSEVDAGISDRRSELGSLLRIQREIDRVLDDVIGSFGTAPSSWRQELRSALGRASTSLFRPSVDIAGDEQTYQITLDIPGVKASDLNIEIRGNAMTITGERESAREERNGQVYRLERSRGVFRRTLTLPEDADLDNIDAALADGVLKLNIPRLESKAEDVRRIPVRDQL